MSTPDLSQMLEQAQQLQAKMAELQREVAARRIEGSAGGGMVTAVVSGDLRVLELRIEPALYESGDRGMLQDLCAAAVNAALARARSTMQEELQKLGGGLALGGLGGLDGLFGGGQGGA